MFFPLFISDYNHVILVEQSQIQLTKSMFNHEQKTKKNGMNVRKPKST